MSAASLQSRLLDLLATGPDDGVSLYDIPPALGCERLTAFAAIDGLTACGAAKLEVAPDLLSAKVRLRLKETLETLQ